jgi:hypothetical protein
MILKTLMLAAVVLAGCADRKPITPESYASVYARAKLIREHFKDRPDSADRYLGALYRESGLTPERMDAFLDEKRKHPQDMEKLQRLIMDEINRLDPRKPPAPGKAP